MIKIGFNNLRPCVIGLGYVGLPVFLNLQYHIKTVGYDVNKERVQYLKRRIDTNNEFKKKKLVLKKKSVFSSSFNDIKNCNFFIITLPTPLKKNNKPDMSILHHVSKKLSKILKFGDIIVFESTVYPGACKELITKYLQPVSGLIENKDFFVCYSPERINPGDKKHTLKNTKKILAIKSKNLYVKKKTIYIYKKITNKIVLTNNIEEAEMAKLIENVQRDINIAITNDIFLFSKKMGFNFKNINNLASTKWNFRKFNPGLVGGHCLPVDPYYLIDVAKKNSIKMKTVLSGRAINNEIGRWTQQQIEKKIRNRNYKKIYFLGITYKKNSSDTRNSLPLDIYKNLRKKYQKVYAVDNYCGIKDRKKYMILNKIKEYNKNSFYIFLLNHKENYKIFKKIKKNHLDFYDPFGFFQ
tara:strand:- start:14588 stop:15820 length:1233 start_codon:yes stop_codon:yes gene_type:complete